MADPVRDLFDEFRRQAEAGHQPSVADYLTRAGDDADALADLLDAFLIEMPAREAPPETLAAVRALAAGEPTLLAQRTERGVTRKAVVDALMGRLSLSETSRPKVEERYHELESGLLDAGRVDGGVLDAIASALGIVRSHLVFGRPSLPQQPAYLRMPPGETLAIVSGGLPESTETSEEPDEVDRLFGVGP